MSDVTVTETSSSSNTQLQTHFASPDRSDQEAIVERAYLVSRQRQLCHVIDALPQFVAVLDGNRQIVGANRVLVDALGGGELAKVLGARPGEGLQCEHSTQTPAGCGTSEACSKCGAVLAILAAQDGESTARECQVPQSSGDSLDLRVHASPIEIDGEELVLFSATDIASEKRREVLERTFFHDIINSAGGIQSIAEIFKHSEDPGEQDELRIMLANLAGELLDEIRAQRELLAAERWELEPQVETFRSSELLDDLHCLYQRHPVGEGKHLAIHPGSQDTEIVNARALAFRVIGNMIKNALEASQSGGTVTVGCERDSDHAVFWVHNESVIPRDVQLQIFNRSFSTKGTGRGIGTYSMKMLTERYLGGKVSFRSDEQTGTTFKAMIALQA